MHSSSTQLILGQAFVLDSPLSCTAVITPMYVITSGAKTNGSVTGYDNTTFMYAGEKYGAFMHGNQQLNFTNLQNNQGYQVAYWFDCTADCPWDPAT